MAKKAKKSKLALPVGILTIVMAIIGVIATIIYISNLAQARKNKEIEKANYEAMIKPVVMFDPTPFDDLSQADKSQLLYAAVWNILMDEEGMSKYPYAQGETFGIQVPQEDIAKSFNKLFGNEIDVTTLYNTVDMSVYDITYDSALQSYILPITGVDSVYTPKVYDIKKQGNSVVLTVGYIGNKAWADLNGDTLTAPEPDKYMQITLRDSSNGSYIASIKEADGQEVAEKILTSQYFEVTETVTEATSESETYIAEEPTEETTEVSYENVTDENGEAVTDENGENVTQVVTTEAQEEPGTISEEMTVY